MPLRSLIEHFEHWDTTNFPLDVQSYYCLITTPAQVEACLVVASPCILTSECGIPDRYWRTETTAELVFHCDHRELRETDERVVAWIATKDPMLSPFELNDRLEKQEQEIRFLRSRVFQLEAELERDEEEIRADERERIHARLR
jgi:hypothetical protein